MDLRGGVKAKIKLFSEYGHVAYQIKADDFCSNVVPNILPTDTPSTQGWGQKVEPYIFVKVAYQIKKMSTEHHERKHAVITHTNDP